MTLRQAGQAVRNRLSVEEAAVRLGPTVDEPPSRCSDQLDPITVQEIRGAGGDPSIFVTGHRVVTAV
jgi:hypothetical protein